MHYLLHYVVPLSTLGSLQVHGTQNDHTVRRSVLFYAWDEEDERIHNVYVFLGICPAAFLRIRRRLRHSNNALLGKEMRKLRPVFSDNTSVEPTIDCGA
jgi:hypothetical protein